MTSPPSNFSALLLGLSIMNMSSQMFRQVICTCKTFATAFAMIRSNGWEGENLVKKRTKFDYVNLPFTRMNTQMTSKIALATKCSSTKKTNKRTFA